MAMQCTYAFSPSSAVQAVVEGEVQNDEIITRELETVIPRPCGQRERECQMETNGRGRELSGSKFLQEEMFKRE